MYIWAAQQKQNLPMRLKDKKTDASAPGMKYGASLLRTISPYALTPKGLSIRSGILLSMFLIFAARPVSVFISLIFSKYKVKEKLAVSWIGLRGAVPIILATIPLSSGIDDSHKIFNLVFFIVISSALIQGWTIKYITKIFKVSAKSEQEINSPIQFESLGNNTSELFDIIVPFNSKMKRKTIIDLNLPKDCLIIFVCRDEIFFVPNGNTVLQAGDVLQILMNKKDLPMISDKLR